MVLLCTVELLLLITPEMVAFESWVMPFLTLRTVPKVYGEAGRGYRNISPSVNTCLCCVRWLAPSLCHVIPVPCHSGTGFLRLPGRRMFLQYKNVVTELGAAGIRDDHGLEHTPGALIRAL